MLDPSQVVCMAIAIAMIGIMMQLQMLVYIIMPSSDLTRRRALIVLYDEWLSDDSDDLFGLLFRCAISPWKLRRMHLGERKPLLASCLFTSGHDKGSSWVAFACSCSIGSCSSRFCCSCITFLNPQHVS